MKKSENKENDRKAYPRHTEKKHVLNHHIPKDAVARQKPENMKNKTVMAEREAYAKTLSARAYHPKRK